jgi:hypothetical protein
LIALTPTHAQAQKEEHKLTLRAIMQELGTEHLRLTNALLLDDLETAEGSAKAIQGHPLPAEILTAIKSKLGKDFRAFERMDELLYDWSGVLPEEVTLEASQRAGAVFSTVLADICFI